MSFVLKTTVKVEDATDFIVSTISGKLLSGKKVLFFATGGSSIVVGLKVAEILREQRNKNFKNLTVLLTDERYGPVGHPDSNFFQLTERGFSIPEAKIIQILNGEDHDAVADKFDKILDKELKSADYKIGLFGIGADGHTAGILPNSEAVYSEKWAFGYDTPLFYRITITPKTIEKLDEAIVWAQGKDKWKILKNLNDNISMEKQPAQILKKVPLLTIFSDM